MSVLIWEPNTSEVLVIKTARWLPVAVCRAVVTSRGVAEKSASAIVLDAATATAAVAVAIAAVAAASGDVDEEEGEAP